MNPNNAAQPADVLVDYEVYQEDELVASSNSLAHAEHYAEQYSQDGPVELRTSISIPGFHAVESALLSKLRAPVADERVSPPLPAAWGSAINDAGDGHVDLYSAEQMQEYTRAALASAPIASPIQWPTMPASKGQSPVLFEDGYAEGWAKCMDECQRAVSAASAPVAGEAVPSIRVFVKDGKASHPASSGPRLPDGFHVFRLTSFPLVFGDAAPQASADALEVARAALMEIADLADVEADQRGVIVNQALAKIHRMTAAPRASEAVPQQHAGDVPPLPRVMERPDWLRGYADTCEFQARKTSHGTLYNVAESLRAIADWCEDRAALSAQPAAEPLSNPKQFALTAADERTAFEATYQADYDDPGAACEREHFGKGYRAGLASQSGAQKGDSDAG